MKTTLILTADAANDNRAPGRVGGIKSLLCDACGTVEATRDGFCEGCISEINAHLDAGRYHCGDDEGELLARGVSARDGASLAADDDGETLSDWCRPRCPGGCHAGLVADPHGPSMHNPTGLEPCPFCG